MFRWLTGQSNRTLAGALEVERNVMFLILTLILLVAALNVSGLVMLVRDKHRDIAVLRSMGASRGMVLRVFSSPVPALELSGRWPASASAFLCLY